MKLFAGVGRGPRTNRLHFGGDPDRDRDPGFLIYSCDSHRQPRIERGNPRRRFALY